MQKGIVAGLLLGAAVCICVNPAVSEETDDDLSAIDRELEGEQIRAASPEPAGSGEGYARKSVPVINTETPGNAQTAVEGYDSSWVKRDMNEICGTLDMLKSDKRKGKPFQFDRDDLDTSRTGKPDHIPRDAYNDNQ